MKELTIIEQAILDMLPVGENSKIGIAQIMKLVDLSKREVQAVIFTLRRKGVPILATRGVNGGYYIASDSDELNDDLHAFRSQQKNMEITIKYLERIDPKTWHKNLIYGGGKGE